MKEIVRGKSKTLNVSLIEKKKGIKSTSKQPLKDFEDKSKVKPKQTDRRK